MCDFQFTIWFSALQYLMPPPTPPTQLTAVDTMYYIFVVKSEHSKVHTSQYDEFVSFIYFYFSCEIYCPNIQGHST